MKNLDKKIERIRANQEKLKVELEQLEAQKQLNQLGVEHPDVLAIYRQIEELAVKIKTNPKKVLSVLSAKQKGSFVPREKKEVAIKYRDTAPGCENNTWSGRGLMPLWLKRYEAAGRSRADFLIKA